MEKYEITVEDIYDKTKNKTFTVHQSNVQLAHKDGLRHCNALREEISKISLRGKTVYSFRTGFADTNE